VKGIADAISDHQGGSVRRPEYLLHRS